MNVFKIVFAVYKCIFKMRKKRHNKLVKNETQIQIMKR